MKEKEVKNISEEDYLKLKRSNSKKTTIIVVLVFTMILMVVLIALYYFNGKEKEGEKTGVPTPTPTSANVKYENKISNGEYETYGIVYVKGYAKVEEYEEKFEGVREDETIKKYNLVAFYVTDSFGTDLEKEIPDWFRSNRDDVKYIDLGCLNDNIITLERVADDWYDPSITGTDNKDNFDNYWKKVSLSKSDSEKILSSTKDKPITVKLEKLKFSLGGGSGSVCTSTVSGVEVIN